MLFGISYHFYARATIPKSITLINNLQINNSTIHPYHHTHLTLQQKLFQHLLLSEPSLKQIFQHLTQSTTVNPFAKLRRPIRPEQLSQQASPQLLIHNPQLHCSFHCPPHIRKLDIVKLVLYGQVFNT